MTARLRQPLLLATLLFVIAAGMRLAFVTATPDGTGPFSPFYKGDAPVWLSYAASLQQGQPFALELGLPLRPPGTAWLVAWLWDGTPAGFGGLRVAYALLGALLAPLTFAAARSLGLGSAVVAGGLVAVGSGPLWLSGSPNSEVPYALLAVAGIWMVRRLGARARPLELGAWAVLQGITCLFRAEHLLFAGLVFGWLCLRWRRDARVAWSAVAVRAGACALLAVAPMVPWHVSAFAAVERYNETERPPVPPRTLPWTADAVAELEAVPGFARAATQRFVEATVRHRGGDRVGVEQLGVLDEAFAFRPRPLPGVFFVALYGPLNFRLANGPEADGGFSRQALARPPVLAGGADRYPPDWLASLPSGGNLSLDYPPHLQVVLDGYGLGARWILAHPLDFAGLAFAKLSAGWSGVAHGFGGYAIPIGADGIRRRVDMTVPTGAFAVVWRLAWLALAVVGAWRVRRRVDASPWLLWILAGGLTTVAFFGYARQGAQLAPAFAVLVAAAVAPVLRNRERALAAIGGAALAALLLVEGVRWLSPPELRVDGVEAGRVEPWPPLEFEDRRVESR